MGRHQRNFIGPACAASAGLLAVVAAIALDVFATRPDLPAAILFPADASREQAFRIVIAAGGRPIRDARFRLWDGVVWIAAGDDPDFFQRVTALGALAVINPLALGGCLLARPS
jgi:hypothetical protein